MNVKKIAEIQFGFLSTDEIEKISVISDDKRGITIPETRENLDPKKGGLSDLRLGTIDQNLSCQTCGLDAIQCPGHFGHIGLAKPVFHISLLQTIVNVLGCVCIRCSKLLLDRTSKMDKELEYLISTSSTSKIRFTKIKNLLKNVKYCNKENYGCGAIRPKIKREERPRIDIIAEFVSSVKTESENVDLTEKIIKQTLTPEIVYEILKNISDEDYRTLGFNPDVSRLENMIIQTIPVPPIAVRPSIQNQADNTICDDDITHKLADIVKINSRIQKHLETHVPYNPQSELTKSLLLVLQYHSATLIDNEIIGTPSAIQRNGKPIKSISSRIRHKDGRIRQHLMGKRVNFSARTVITPDPLIGIDELGIPIRIATTLTVPITVTESNINDLIETVKNGRTYPGANFILINNSQFLKPRKIDLRYGKQSLINLKVGDTVERHLINGDIVLFNRQPSLHKYSMMAHKIKVIRDPNHLTFRMNVCVCPPYNADFDGDEMNLHVPQSVQTRTELEYLAWIPLQIVSTAKGQPIIGMVMDSLLGSWLLTTKDIVLSKYDCMNLLIRTTLDKTKIKLTKESYTGVELFSYILPETLNMSMGNSKNPSLLIKNGKIVKGTLGKSSVGPSENSIIHCIWNDFGPLVCRDFINNTQHLINAWLLYYHGFSVGLGDVAIDTDTINQIQGILADSKKKVNDSILEVESGVSNIDYETMELKLLQELTSIRDKAGKMVIDKIDHNNRMFSMIKSGSKGKTQNIAQISACLGQQELSGTGHIRIGKLYNGRTLPHYCVDDDTAEARGFVSNSYLTGLDPQEFFFHMMGGRIGLIDTAVKTSDTGYIQRRLIKALEDIMVKYDGTVRNAQDQIIQFTYGDTGYDVTYLEYQNLNILKMGDLEIENEFLFTKNELSEINKIRNNKVDIIYNVNTYSSFTEEDNHNYVKKILNFRNKIRKYYLAYNFDDMLMEIGYKIPFNLDRLILNNNKKTNNRLDLHPSYILEVLNNLIQDKYIYSVYLSDEEFSNKNSFKHIVEYYSKLVIKAFIYSKLSPKQCISELKLSKQEFNTIILHIRKSLSRLIQPGEMVGIVAAQSIGEPSTQITLNTFHSAGISAQGTGSLGLPRLKELMSVTKNISTPFTYIKFLDDYKFNKEYVTKIKTYTDKVILHDIYQSIYIYYDPNLEYMESDNVENIYYVTNIYNKKCSENINKMDWLIRIVLNKEQLLEKAITVFQIRASFCNFINNQKVKKDQKNIIDQILSCAILSNYDNNEQSIIHIRLELSKININHIIKLKDLLLNKLQFRGVDNIIESNITTNTVIQFDKNNKYIESNEKEYKITALGINLPEIFKLKGININTTYCNDIHIINKYFGLEAARTILMKEYRSIGTGGEFKSINYAHISILVDFMCHTGKIISIDRYGINKLNTDPLARASFEETTDQLINAALFGEKDSMKSVSSNIMAGQVIEAGTGLCEIMFDTDALETSDVLNDQEFTDDNLLLSNQNELFSNILESDNNSELFVPIN